MILYNYYWFLGQFDDIATQEVQYSTCLILFSVAHDDIGYPVCCLMCINLSCVLLCDLYGLPVCCFTNIDLPYQVSFIFCYVYIVFLYVIVRQSVYPLDFLCLYGFIMRCEWALFVVFIV